MIDIQALINESIERNNQVRSGGRNKSKFHVSDAGTCYRKRFYKRLGEGGERSIPIANLRKMVAGDAGHTMLQKVLARNGNMFSAEGTVENEHIIGHYDGIVKEGKAKAMVELKTIEKWGMTHIKGTCSCKKTGRDCTPGPKKEHLLQMKTYWLFAREDYTHLDEAVLSYIKREDFEAKDFRYKWSKTAENEVYDEWEPLIAYWIAGELPPCTCHEDYGGMGKNYCLYPSKSHVEGTGSRERVVVDECCSEQLYTDYLARKELEEEK